jgi:hypothetical protein
MTIYKLYNELTYITGRVTALASRPLMLLFLNHWVGNDLASAVAVIFLVTILATALSAFDTHRSFYQAYFGIQKNKGVRSLYRLYCNTIIFQVVVVAPLIAALIVYRTADTVLAVFVSFYFISERLADEAQRFLIFKGSRKEWGGRIIAKTMLQLVGVCTSAYIFGSAASWPIVLSLMFGNLFAYGIKFPWRYLSVSKLDWEAAITDCLSQRLYWLLSLISIFISHFDRVVVMLFKQSDMAIYTVMVSCISIIQNVVDYFFVAPRRRDILQGQLGLRDLFLYRNFYVILGIGAFVGCLGSWLMIKVYHGQQDNDIELIPVILFSQIALSITLVLREIVYWNLCVRRLVWIEGCFIVLCFVTASALRVTEHEYNFVLSMISLFLGLRMSWMIWVIAKAQKSTK